MSPIEKLQQLIDPSIKANDYPLITLLHIRNIIRDNNLEKFQKLLEVIQHEINTRM